MRINRLEKGRRFADYNRMKFELQGPPINWLKKERILVLHFSVFPFLELQPYILYTHWQKIDRNFFLFLGTN